MPEFPRRELESLRARQAAAPRAIPAPSPQPDFTQSLGRFFREMRRTLGVSPHQAAANLLTHVDVIEALESGNLAHLPPWPETVRIVRDYTAAAGVDGRPVLAAVAEALRHAPQMARLPKPARPQKLSLQIAPERLRRAGSAIREGARRLPREALKEARQKPVKALYALSLPAGILILLLNTSILPRSLAHLPGAFVSALAGGRDWLSTQFAPVKDGQRWIEVDDPRSRRGDKLPLTGR